jgi:ribonuclease H2 subunit C
MLAVQPGKHSSEQKCTPNILPCRVNHNGPINASERYWNPTVEDGKSCGLVYGIMICSRDLGLARQDKNGVLPWPQAQRKGDTSS